MATTPQITLTANLESIVAGGAAAGYLRITLCGYGPQTPVIPGTAMLADAGVPQLIGPQAGSTALSVMLFGNDVIVPSGTVYEIAVLDANKDVIQANNYALTGSGSQDLSTLAPIVPPYGFPIAGLAYAACAGSGRNWTAPGGVLAVAYNGVLLTPNATLPTLGYTVAGNQITLNFPVTDPEDSIYAFCLL